MSQLSGRLAALKGSQKTSDIIAKANVSRETFRKIERGEAVKLSTLRQIAKALHVSEEEWLDLLIAWIQTEVGKDSHYLWIETKESGHSRLHDATADQTAKAMMLFQELNHTDRLEIIKAMQRPEVMACIRGINGVWEKFDDA
jgi:transcriptional regulator with XRE-family HTH domain